MIAGAEPKEFDRRVSGLFKINIGMRREVIGAQHIGLPGMLHAQLRSIKGEALTLHFAPDLFMTREVRVWLTQLQGRICTVMMAPTVARPFLLL